MFFIYFISQLWEWFEYKQHFKAIGYIVVAYLHTHFYIYISDGLLTSKTSRNPHRIYRAAAFTMQTGFQHRIRTVDMMIFTPKYKQEVEIKKKLNLYYNHNVHYHQGKKFSMVQLSEMYSVGPRHDWCMSICLLISTN